jgi:hypothetical protein
VALHDHVTIGLRSGIESDELLDLRLVTAAFYINGDTTAVRMPVGQPRRNEIDSSRNRNHPGKNESQAGYDDEANSTRGIAQNPQAARASRTETLWSSYVRGARGHPVGPLGKRSGWISGSEMPDLLPGWGA